MDIPVLYPDGKISSTSLDDSALAIFNAYKRAADRVKGGEGSGHHGHAGRPGEVGGSAPASEGAPKGEPPAAEAAPEGNAAPKSDPPGRREIQADEMDDFDLREEYQKWWDSLDQTSQNAVRAYTGGDYWSMNSYMRYGTLPENEENFRIRWDMDVQEACARLKELFKDKSIEGDFSETPTFRGMENVKPDVLEKLKFIGGLFADKGFLSSSRSAAYAHQFAGLTEKSVLFTIRTPKGSPVPFLPLNTTEHEILFPPETVLRIIEARIGEVGRLEVEVEALYAEE